MTLLSDMSRVYQDKGQPENAFSCFSAHIRDMVEFDVSRTSNAFDEEAAAQIEAVSFLLAAPLLFPAADAAELGV